MREGGGRTPSNFDFSKIIKNVTKLVKEKTEDIFGNVSPLEKTLREINDEDSCAVSNSLLRHIAMTTNDGAAYHTVAQVVWQGITSESWCWRRVYKCLSLLEFMVLLGPERCRQDCNMAAMTLRNLTAFRYHDGEREQGAGVRQKAEAILHLLEDEDAWKQAKEQAVQDSQTYSGGIENLPYFSPINHYNLYNRSSNPFFSGPEALPPLQIRQFCADPSLDMPPAGPPFGGAPPFGGGPPMGGAHSFGGCPAPGTIPSSRLYDPDDDFRTANPFSSLSKFQSEAEAAGAWGLSKPGPPAGSKAEEPSANSMGVKHQATNRSQSNRNEASEPKPTPNLIDLEPTPMIASKPERNPIDDLLGDDSLPASLAVQTTAMPTTGDVHKSTGELIDLFGSPAQSSNTQPAQVVAAEGQSKLSASPNLLDL